VGTSVAACAGIVGADFGDVQGENDGGLAAGDDGGHQIEPTDDGGGFDAAQPDASKIIIVTDGGVCPTGSGLTACNVSGEELCVDTTTDPSHCGNCATDCPSDPHGNAVCVSSSCTYACRGGFSLCDAGNGCCAVTTSIPDAGVDSGPPATPDPGIPCGKSYCAANADAGTFCCGANESEPSGDFCANNATPQGEIGCTYEFSCGSAGDCPTGNVCCYDTNDYSQDGDQNGESSFCQASCSGFDNYVQFCNPQATGECPGGQTCTGTFQGDQDELEATYHYCK
jgi:hypothetical protein